jgi:hypothetical protein
VEVLQGIRSGGAAPQVHGQDVPSLLAR